MNDQFTDDQRQRYQADVAKAVDIAKGYIKQYGLGAAASMAISFLAMQMILARSPTRAIALEGALFQHNSVEELIRMHFDKLDREAQRGPPTN